MGRTSHDGIRNIRRLIVTIVNPDPIDLVPKRADLDAILKRYPRLIPGNDRQYNHLLVQNLIDLHILEQRQRRAKTTGREIYRRSGNPWQGMTAQPRNQLLQRYRFVVETTQQQLSPQRPGRKN